MKYFLKSVFTLMGQGLYQVRKQVEIKTLPAFPGGPRNLRINLPRNIANPHRIFLGDNVHLGPGSFLLALTEYPTEKMRCREFPAEVRHYKPSIYLGNSVTSTSGLHVCAFDRITIEDHVMFASNVFVGDHHHGYATASVPYKYQPVWKIAPVTIKRGCWIGQNAMIMPGVVIGENSIIGANSVVNSSIPPGCIAVGAPARVIRQWDWENSAWTDTESKKSKPSGAWINAAHEAAFGQRGHPGLQR